MNRGVDIPPGWVVYGELPEEGYSGLLPADILQVQSEDKSITIDITWHPPFQAEGEFHCIVVKDGHWETALKDQAFKSLGEVMVWLAEIFAVTSGVSGKPYR